MRDPWATMDEDAQEDWLDAARLDSFWMDLLKQSSENNDSWRERDVESSIEDMAQAASESLSDRLMERTKEGLEKWRQSGEDQSQALHDATTGRIVRHWLSVITTARLHAVPVEAWPWKDWSEVQNELTHQDAVDLITGAWGRDPDRAMDILGRFELLQSSLKSRDAWWNAWERGTTPANPAFVERVIDIGPYGRSRTESFMRSWVLHAACRTPLPAGWHLLQEKVGPHQPADIAPDKLFSTLRDQLGHQANPEDFAHRWVNALDRLGWLDWASGSAAPPSHAEWLQTNPNWSQGPAVRAAIARHLDARVLTTQLSSPHTAPTKASPRL